MALSDVAGLFEVWEERLVVVGDVVGEWRIGRFLFLLELVIIMCIFFVSFTLHGVVLWRYEAVFDENL
jgi:hypothetical protein